MGNFHALLVKIRNLSIFIMLPPLWIWGDIYLSPGSVNWLGKGIVWILFSVLALLYEALSLWRFAERAAAARHAGKPRKVLNLSVWVVAVALCVTCLGILMNWSEPAWTVLFLCGVNILPILLLSDLALESFSQDLPDQTRSPQASWLLPKSVRKIADEQKLGELQWIQSAPSPPRNELLFEEGMVITEGSLSSPTIQAVYHWNEVRLLKTNLSWYIRYDRDLGNIFDQCEWTFEMEFDDDNSATIALTLPGRRTLAQNFFQYGPRSSQQISPAGRVVRLLEEKVAESQLKRIQTSLEAGNEVPFGEVTASLQGISINAQLFPWNRVQAIDMFLPSSRYVASLMSGENQSVTVPGARLKFLVKDFAEATNWRDIHEITLTLHEITNYKALQALHKIMTSSTPLSLRSEDN